MRLLRRHILRELETLGCTLALREVYDRVLTEAVGATEE